MSKNVPYIAPEFTLFDAAGNKHALADYHGSWVIVYFYPKDDTPGCTIEACGFRDMNEAILAHKATVIGISRDSGESHQQFERKYSLNFMLLSDPDHAVMDAYKAWGKKMFGQEGVLRKTFIIDPSGNVVKEYGRVTPVGHAEQVLKDLQTLQQTSR